MKLRNDLTRVLSNKLSVIEKNKTLAGFGWNFINQFGVQFLNLLFSIFLARLLSPEEYGLIAMVTIFTGFSAVLLDFGFGNALIYKDNPTNKDWSSVFWFNTIVGGIICLIIILFSEKIAGFYNEEVLQPIAVFLSFNFVFNAMSITQNAKIRKAIDFKSLASVNLISIIFSGIVGIVFALSNYGVWSLVAQRLTDSFCRFIGLFIVTKWFPVYGFSINSIRAIFGYSIYSFGANIIAYWSRNLDNLLIGRFVNKVELGLYSRAYTFLMFPITSISRVISTVLFPTFSKIKNDIDKIKTNYLAISRMVAFIVFPLMLILFLGAKEITLLVFGVQWLPMAPYLKLFSFIGMYQSLLGLNGPLYMALGKTKLNFQLNLFTQLVNISALIIGVNWGVYGIITAIYVATCINFFPVNYFILKELKIRFFEPYLKVLPILGLNCIAFIPLYFLPFTIVNSTLVLLGFKVLSYLFVYVCLAKLTKNKELDFILKIIKQKIKK